MSESPKPPNGPLILKQNPQKTQQRTPQPYRFGRDTYDLYANANNPFLGRELANEAIPLALAPQQVQSLFHHLKTQKRYELGFPTQNSAYRKRKVASHAPPPLQNPEFPDPEQFRENTRKLKPFIQLFFQDILAQLRDDPQKLPIIVNEVGTLFQEYELTLKIFDAFRMFQSWEQFIQTLERISEDDELENFEFFCSALFGFYSQFQ